jgi:hypothetical protein
MTEEDAVAGHFVDCKIHLCRVLISAIYLEPTMPPRFPDITFIS